MSDNDPYLYLGAAVLRNRLGLRDQVRLDAMERRLVLQRVREGIPSGCFDLDHLRAIHRHLFQDVYDWAGQVRMVEIAKGGSQFQFRRFIETGMADVHGRLEKVDFLRRLSDPQFARAAARIMGDVNHVHPFRDGNGRTQLFYLEQLAERAGHRIDLTRLDAGRWIEASRISHDGDHDAMAAEIGRAIEV